MNNNIKRFKQNCLLILSVSIVSITLCIISIIIDNYMLGLPFVAFCISVYPFMGNKEILNRDKVKGSSYSQLFTISNILFISAGILCFIYSIILLIQTLI